MSWTSSNTSWCWDDLGDIFHVVGRQFDKDGNLRQWWSPDVIHAFKERAQCIVEQYGNYTVPEVGMKVT